MKSSLHSRSSGEHASRLSPAAGPSHVGGFRLGRSLGRGRGCEVFIGQEPSHGGLVAIKLLRRDASAAGTPLPFAHEFALLAAVRHPNVIRVYDHGMDGPWAYLCTEYAAGGDLGPRMARGLALAEAIDLMRQALSGLAQLHAQGLVHRDIKPANLLLRAEGSLALADFGIACQQGAAGGPPPMMIGTPRYAAPEQLEGATAHPAADLYSLGVVFHEMLSGRPLFPGETPQEIVSQHLVASIPLLPPGLGKWQPLLDRMLAKDPRDRPPSAQLVLAQLQQIASASDRSMFLGSKAVRYLS